MLDNLNEETTVTSKGEKTRQRIKLTALRLYALKGLSGVSAREILREAGQKNVGSINYYFSSRGALISELIQDVAKLLDELHNRRIDEMEAAGGPLSMRDIIKVLIQIPPFDRDESDVDEYSFRFIVMMLINHRDQLVEAMQGYDSGSRRCLAHIRRLAPQIPPKLLQQRLMLVMIYIVATGSSREAARDDMRAWHNLWGSPAVMENLADTVIGIVCQPPSKEALEELEAAS